jgi:hypothetical protein
VTKKREQIRDKKEKELRWTARQKYGRKGKQTERKLERNNMGHISIKWKDGKKI